MDRYKVLIQSNSSEHQTTGKLCSDLAEELTAEGFEVKLLLRSLPNGIRPKIKRLVRLVLGSRQQLLQYDALIVHSALSLSLIDIIMARFMKKPVIAFVWDLYPESTVQAGTMRNPLVVSLYWVTERIGLRLASFIFVPTIDYLPYLERYARKTSTYPLWPGTTIMDPRGVAGEPTNQLRLVFAGQINAIRGIGNAMTQLCDLFPNEKVHLDVFSSDALPDDLCNLAREYPGFTVESRGFVAREVLLNELGGYDFGLVAIDKSFTLPAFPSKITTYMAAGLPFLYFGPGMKEVTNLASAPRIGVLLSDAKERGLVELRVGNEEFSHGRQSYLDKVRSARFELVRQLR